VTAAVLAASWTDAGSLGYPVLFGAVLLGSVVPVVPTGAVVGAAAAVATTTGHLSLPLVVLLSALGAFAGDVITFGICRFGGPAAVRWVARGQHAERIDEVREQFRQHGWQIVVVGRLLPAGRIPVLVAAGALAYPWRRLLPASFTGGLLWAVAYALLGVVSGGIFDSPLIATLIATALVLLVGLVLNLVSSHRVKRSPALPRDEPPALSRDRAPELPRDGAPEVPGAEAREDGDPLSAPAGCEQP
jgi:membrane protein DedA with SNARE-associated domain